MESPVTVKVGQVFTGFGIGCGVGVGVGRPLNLGAIPMLHQVMTATRGATDAFSGVGMHVNSSLRRLGMKNIEAGIGCGVGIGHGFGVGLALKPSFLLRIQSYVGQAMAKAMMKLGIAPSSSVGGITTPLSLQSNMQIISGTSGMSVQGPVENVMQLASRTTDKTLLDHSSVGSSHTQSTYKSTASKGTSDVAFGSRTKKVISNFLQNPILTSEDTEPRGMAGQLHSEDNVLQLLLKYQQVIEELKQENKKLRQILLEDLKVSPSKLQADNENRTLYNVPCSDCFECRRRLRKLVR